LLIFQEIGEAPKETNQLVRGVTSKDSRRSPNHTMHKGVNHNPCKEVYFDLGYLLDTAQLAMLHPSAPL